MKTCGRLDYSPQLFFAIPLRGLSTPTHCQEPCIAALWEFYSLAPLIRGLAMWLALAHGTQPTHAPSKREPQQPWMTLVFFLWWENAMRRKCPTEGLRLLLESWNEHAPSIVGSQRASNIKYEWEGNLCWGCLLRQHDLERKLTDTQ